MQDDEAIQIMRAKYSPLHDQLDERTRRLWAAAEANALGHGGTRTVSKAHRRELKHMNHDSQDQHGLPVKWCCETITTIFRRVPCWSKAMIPTVWSSYKRYPSWGTPGRRRSCRVCLPTSPSRLVPSRPFSACEAWRPRMTSCGAWWPMSWGPCRRLGWAPGRS